ncbi:hypothetical protein [Aminobacter aminovorans]|jgi:hypothetical protein|nr:hypothetical protein [Aminobacter aminovorans]
MPAAMASEPTSPEIAMSCANLDNEVVDQFANAREYGWQQCQDEPSGSPIQGLKGFWISSSVRTMRGFILALISLTALTTSARADGSAYVMCVRQNAQYYGAYCFPLDAIVEAVIGVCRPKAKEFLHENPNLTSGEKAVLTEKFIDTMRSSTYREILDFRIEQKIDCGQYNNALGPEGVKGIAK